MCTCTITPTAAVGALSMHGEQASVRATRPTSAAGAFLPARYPLLALVSLEVACLRYVCGHIWMDNGWLQWKCDVASRCWGLDGDLLHPWTLETVAIGSSKLVVMFVISLSRARCSTMGVGSAREDASRVECHLGGTTGLGPPEDKWW